MSDLKDFYRACVILVCIFPTLNKTYCIALHCKNRKNRGKLDTLSTRISDR